MSTYYYTGSVHTNETTASLRVYVCYNIELVFISFLFSWDSMAVAK
jgi:hypothetical protein